MVGELKANQKNKAEINMRIILQIHSAHCSAVHAAVVHFEQVFSLQPLMIWSAKGWAVIWGQQESIERGKYSYETQHSLCFLVYNGKKCKWVAPFTSLHMQASNRPKPGL